MRSFVFAAITAMGCNYATANECVKVAASQIEEIRSAILLEIPDADTAKFHDVCKVSVREKEFYCGYINAKNQYGGYSGYRLFQYGTNDFWRASREAFDTPKTNIVIVENENVGRSAILAACGIHEQSN